MNELAAIIIHIYPMATIVLLLLVLLTPVLRRLPEHEWEQINHGYFYVVAAISAAQAILSSIWLFRYGLHGDSVYTGSVAQTEYAYILLDSYSVFAVALISVAILVSTILSGALRLHGNIPRVTAILLSAIASCAVFLVVSIHVYFSLTMWILLIIFLLGAGYVLYTKNVIAIAISSLVQILLLAFGIIIFVSLSQILNGSLDMQSLWVYTLNSPTLKVAVPVTLFAIILLIAGGLAPTIICYLNDKSEENIALKMPILLTAITASTLIFMRILSFLHPPMMPSTASNVSPFLLPACNLLTIFAHIIIILIIAVNLPTFLRGVNSPLIKALEKVKLALYPALVPLTFSVIYLLVLVAFMSVLSQGKEAATSTIIGAFLYLSIFPTALTISIYAPQMCKYFVGNKFALVLKAVYIAFFLYPVTAGLVMITKLKDALMEANIFTPLIWLFIIFAFFSTAFSLYRIFSDKDEETADKTGVNWAVLGYILGGAFLVLMLFAPLIFNGILTQIALSVFSSI